MREKLAITGNFAHVDVLPGNRRKSDGGSSGLEKEKKHRNIYSIYIYICIFGELPLYMHCAAYCLYGRGKSRITSALAATQLGVPELEDGLRF